MPGMDDNIILTSSMDEGQSHLQDDKKSRKSKHSKKSKSPKKRTVYLRNIIRLKSQADLGSKYGQTLSGVNSNKKFTDSRNNVFSQKSQKTFSIFPETQKHSLKFFKVRPTQKWLQDHGLEYRVPRPNQVSRPVTTSLESYGRAKVNIETTIPDSASKNNVSDLEEVLTERQDVQASLTDAWNQVLKDKPQPSIISEDQQIS